MSVNRNIKAIKTPARVPTDFILTWILWGDIMSKPYRLEYCMLYHRQLIVQNIDARTGEEFPRNMPYVCNDCKREQEKKRRENISEHEKQYALMFANYAAGSKCKRGHVIPCSICKAVFNENCEV